MWHSGWNKALSDLMLQTSSKWDKDERYRCCKFVNSFSAPVLTTPDRNVQMKPFEYKHPSLYSRLGQFFPFWEFIFQACQKAPRAVWLLLDCNANRQSPLEFISLEVIWGKPQDAHFSLGLRCASEPVFLRQSSFVQIHNSENHPFPLIQSRKENLWLYTVFHHHQKPRVEGNILQQT